MLTRCELKSFTSTKFFLILGEMNHFFSISLVPKPLCFQEVYSDQFFQKLFEVPAKLRAERPFVFHGPPVPVLHAFVPHVSHALHDLMPDVPCSLRGVKLQVNRASHALCTICFCVSRDFVLYVLLRLNVPGVLSDFFSLVPCVLQIYCVLHTLMQLMLCRLHLVFFASGVSVL